MRALYLGTDETGSSHDSADESGEHTVLVQTTRLARFELEAVLQATGAADSEANDNDGESTLTVDAEENRRLLARAFRNTDDEITLESPVPSIPDDVPSPLGDDTAGPAEHAALEQVIPDVATLPPLDDLTRGDESVPDLPLLAPEALISRVSGMHPRLVTPDEARVVRDAREAERILREEEAKTRLIVLGIWGAAVLLAGLLGFFALMP